MERTKTPDQDVEATNRQMNTPEDRRQTRSKAAFETATLPASGAAIPQAQAGAELSGKTAREETETASAIKRAAENHRRV
jgi:hypothetical protein